MLGEEVRLACVQARGSFVSFVITMFSIKFFEIAIKSVSIHCLDEPLGYSMIECN